MLERLVENPDWLPTLKWLGRHNWLRVVDVKPHDEVRFATECRLHWPEDMPLSVRNHARLFQRLSWCKDFTLWNLYALSKAIQTGPKLIRPRFEQCAALAHTDVNLSPSEYRQPYPHVIVELPERWIQAQADRFGISGHRYVTVYHHEETGHILVQAHHATRLPCGSLMTPNRKTIEEALTVPAKQLGSDLDMSLLDERIGINLCLMMTVYGVRDEGPLWSPKKGLKKKSRKKHKRDFEKDRIALISRGVNLLAFDQEVVFFDRRPPNDEADDREPCERGPVKPHWRRGHFRRVPCGTNRQERRLRFIRPTFVGRHLFEGDPSSTNTTYVFRH